ncbi:hypothetical protein GQ457_10G003070 [Hibiscus cannabinus]
MSIIGSNTTSAQSYTTWHSLMSYFFEGLASILGLVDFALLILACSYCGHSRHLANVGGDITDDLNKKTKVHDEKYFGDNGW